MTDTFQIPALFDTVAQWRAESMQVVNWGGFHGHRQVELSGTATLISGASGTGKSTLMDAYLAVMMPSDVPFNGASNDATTGRARSADQRNLLTYLRGKVDTRRDPESGALRDVNLRGDDQTTWGAAAVTFRNDDERRFTVLRAYIVPKRARGVGDIQMTMATVDDTFDLRRLEEFVPTRFHHLELTGRVPGLVIRDTYQELAYTLQTRLGIGDSGGGNRAMRLLARIQAGQHLPTVDALYKSLVLETPGTYEAADRALAHFSALDEAYEAMDTEERKVRILSPSPSCTTRSNGPLPRRLRSTASPPAPRSPRSRTGRPRGSGTCSTPRWTATAGSARRPAPRSPLPRPGTPPWRSSCATPRHGCATRAATRSPSSRTASTAARANATPSSAPGRRSTSALRCSARPSRPRPTSLPRSAARTSSSGRTLLRARRWTTAATL
ncbi:ATP-binding protein [Curtobacterium sp. 24E2]